MFKKKITKVPEGKTTNRIVAINTAIVSIRQIEADKKVFDEAQKILGLKKEIAKHYAAIDEHVRAIDEHGKQIEDVYAVGIKLPIEPEEVKYKIDKNTGAVLFFNAKGEYVGTTYDLIERQKGETNGK